MEDFEKIQHILNEQSKQISELQSVVTKLEQSVQSIQSSSSVEQKELLKTNTKESSEATIESSVKETIKTSVESPTPNNELSLQDLNSKGFTTNKTPQQTNTVPIKEKLLKSRKFSNDVDLEMKLAVNITSVVGILFILTGIIYGSTLSVLNVYIRSALLYSSGVATLVLGEFLNKKNKSYVSISLTSAGIATLHIATAISYLYYDNVLNLITFILATIIISVLAYMLSIKYDSETISVFATIGGYLPIIILSVNTNYTVFTMIYITIFNMFTYFIVLKKNWIKAKYIAFILSLLVMNTLAVVGLYNDIFDSLVAILFSTLTFLIFTSVSILYPIRNQTEINIMDMFLIGINTASHTIFTFVLIGIYNNDFLGLSALVLVVFYVGLTKYISTTLQNSNNLFLFFKIYTLILSVFLVPFQIHTRYWVILCWLLQSLTFYIYGVYSKDKHFKLFGTFIQTINLFNTLVYYMGYSFINSALFDDGYDVHTLKNRILFILTLSVLWSIVIIFIEAYKAKVNKDYSIKNNPIFIVLKIMSLFTMYFYILFLFIDIIDFNTRYDFTFETIAILIFISLTNFVFSKVKILLDFITTLVITTVSSIQLFVCLFTFFNIPFTETFGMLFIIAVSTLLVKLLIIYIIYFMYKLLDIKDTSILFSVISIVVLINIMLTLTIQYSFDLFSLQLSALLLIVAFISVILGFITNTALLRKINLGIIYLVLCKVFLGDVSYSTATEKFINYIVFGITLLFVSFSYVSFSKLSSVKQKDNREE